MMPRTGTYRWTLSTLNAIWHLWYVPLLFPSYRIWFMLHFSSALQYLLIDFPQTNDNEIHRWSNPDSGKSYGLDIHRVNLRNRSSEDTPRPLCIMFLFGSTKFNVSTASSISDLGRPNKWKKKILNEFCLRISLLELHSTRTSIEFRNESISFFSIFLTSFHC